MRRRPNSPRLPCGWAGLVALLLLLCGVVSAQQPEWWNRDWSRRILLRAAGRQENPDAQWASHRVHLPVGADLQGRGIVVVGPGGQPVPFQVVESTRDGHHLLAFRAPASDGVYAVYYGRRNPPAIRHVQPGPRLLTYTMPIPEGLDSSKWDAVQKALAEGRRYGTDFAPNIYRGHNPFGPSEDYITVYDGHLRVEKAGEYRFSVLNEHTCYLLIDGEMVDGLTGWQNLGRLRRPREGAAVQLSAGLHEMQFVAFSYDRAMRHAVAWARPGNEQFAIIPAAAFPGPLQMHEMRTESAPDAPCADFRADARSYCESGGARMVGVQFRFSGTPGAGAVKAYRWSFGDGLSSAAPQPDHVYLEPGLYTVRLEVVYEDGRRAGAAKLVQVDPVWTDLDFRQPKLDAFWAATQDYAVQNLQTDCLLGAWRFWRSIEQHEAAARALLVLAERHKALTDAARYDVAMAMAEYYQTRDPDAQKAEQWLKAALATTTEDDAERRWEARFALCDHYYYYERDPAKARMEYEKLRIDFPQADESKRRLALVRIGDTYRSQAKVDRARERYRQAEHIPRFLPAQPRAVVVGATLQRVNAYLAREEGEEALNELETLLWHYPTLRLDGQTTMLRCRAALQQEDWREAKKHADAYIEFADDPNYLPAAHMAAARACEKLGREKEAAEHYRIIARDYKESPQAPLAADALLRYEGAP